MALPSSTTLALSLALPLLIYYLLPYLHNRAIRSVPAPFPAAFSNLWLLKQCRQGHRYLAVQQAHKKLGPVVRIQPNHVSVADIDAIPIIYGHAQGFLKSEYYDAFVSGSRGLFNTRDRAEHTRKRKMVSHLFSARSLGDFEQNIHQNLRELTNQWDRLSATVPDSYVKMDLLYWFNYLALDIIGDLVFSTPFGMLSEGSDIAEIRRTPTSTPVYAPVIQVLSLRGDALGTLGCLPQLKQYAKHLPDVFFSKGMQAVEDIEGVAVTCVNQRLEQNDKVSRKDLSARLLESRDNDGNPIGRDELIAEAMTQLIAGSDTISNTCGAILFHCLHTPGVMKKLQQEIYQASPEPGNDMDFAVAKDLPFLQNVLNETLRIHSTNAQGLPRVVPPGPGVVIHGHLFPPGTVLSVPSYTMHHSQEVWGSDAEEFNPDRWDSATDRQRAAFIPFGLGPRACIGRNVADMALALIISTICKRYDFELYEEELRTREGFLRKPLSCMAGLKRRKT